MVSENIDTQVIDNKNKINIGKRIFYVDPNDVYGTSNGIPLTPDYTDLCVSFDLQVETVPRTGYVTGKKTETEDLGKDVTQTYHFFWTSYQANANPEDNYVSFTKGEEYLDRSYLTTYYTDINFNDFRNKNIVEGLGVESVSISFESYYMPTIKMRFIDVRGASLFGREEATHVDNQITQDSIWGCFFTFPYPKFRLQVKGFYGHPITYQLTCLDFRANFDSKTGNFVIDVTFVGYDYGIMADVPTAYLLAAPYSKYVGEDYWNTKRSSQEWRLSDGNEPKKLIEIRDNIKRFITQSQSTQDGIPINDGTNGADDADAIHELNELRGVKDAYVDIIRCLTDKNPMSNQRIGRVYRLKYRGNLYYFFESVDNSWWRLITEKTAHFYELVNNYKSNFEYRGTVLKAENLVFGREINKEESIGYPNGEKIKFNCTSANSTIEPVTNLRLDLIKGVFNNWKTQDITDIEKFEGTSYYSEGFKSIDAGFPGMELGHIIGYQIIPVLKTEEILSNIEREITSSLEQRVDYSTQQQEATESSYTVQDVVNAVGILPTIENVFKTIMCHFDTLMYMIYECKKAIDTQITAGLRTPEKLGIEGYEFQDYKKQDGQKSGTINIPPWVAVSAVEKKGNTGVKENDYVQSMGWVGDFYGEVEWEEAKLIDGLSLGAWRIYENNSSLNETYFGDASIYSLPTDVFAELFPECVRNTPKRIGQYLAIRAAALFGVVGYKQNAAEALGKADALNFLKVVGQNHIKSYFTNQPGGWQEDLKKAPTLLEGQGNDKNQRVYAIDPGCEGVKASIFKDNGNGKFRYSYTEAIDGQTIDKPSGVKKYGMVYIPIEDENHTFGSNKNPDTNAQFVSTVIPETGDVKKYRKIRVNFNRKPTRVYHKCSTEAFLQKNEAFGDNSTFSNETYNNESMFNIFGGSQFQETCEKINEEYGKLDAESFTVDDYKDTDTTWRKIIKDYWNITEDTYLSVGSDTIEDRYKIVDDNKKNDNFVFLNRFYYNQNEPENNNSRKEEVVEAAKCILFLSTAGYDIKRVVELLGKTNKNHVYQSIPYGAILLLGGLLWRAEQDEDCILWLPNLHGLPPSDSYKKEALQTWGSYEVENKNENKSYIKFYDKKQGYIVSTDWELQRFSLLAKDFDINVKNKLIAEFEYYLKSEDGWVHMKGYEQKTGEDGKQLFLVNDFTKEYEQVVSTEEGKKTIEDIKQEFYNDDYVKILDNHVIVSYGSMSKPDDVNTEITFDKSCWDSYADAFCAKLDEIANYQPTYNSDIPTEERNKEKDLKKAMYMYIKRLWDRWFMMASPEQFEVQNYMQNFIFMDSFYRNIGTLLHINCEKLCKELENINGESMMYQLISTITTDHHCMFFALPDYFGFGDDNRAQENAKNKNMTPEAKIKDMFTPIPYSKKETMETSNKFIVMLTYDHNENLAHINDYTDDGFDIYSHDNNNVLPETFNVLPYSEELALPDVPSEERRVKRYGYNIPSFGVTFGRMNNHLFKNVNIGMTNPIATEQSINALSLIASRGGSNGNQICFYGQDLFPVYNGYSYDCTVEMMGNVQIMPLMYFQLLNMPMFRGTYMIYSVTHTMRPGDMTTTFKGMKLSRFAAPFAEGWYIVSREQGGGFTYDGNGSLVRVYGDDGCECTLDENDVTWDSRHFTLAQMVYSKTAKQMGIDNCPPTEVKVNLKNLMSKCLDKLWDNFGEITVSSGYRGPKLNAEIQNRNHPNRKITPDSAEARKSQHAHGMAADISPKKYSVSNLKLLFEVAIKIGEYDQLIYEAPSKAYGAPYDGNPWIHISYNANGNRHIIYYTRDLNSYIPLTKDNWQNYIK